MNPKVEKRRAFLINIAYIAVIVGLGYVFLKYFFWPAAPFLLSFFFAVLTQKPLRWLDKKTNNKYHTFWSIILVFLSIAVVLVPIILLLVALGKQISNFIGYLGNQLSDFPQFMETLKAELLKILSFLPDGMYTSASDWITNTFNSIVNDFDLSSIGISVDTLKNTVSNGVSGVYSAVKNVPSAVIGIVIGIVAWILFTKDYNRVVRFIQLQLPEGKKNLLVEMKQVFSKTILKMVKAYGIIMLITFCELSLGFTILNLIGVMNNKYVYLIALATAVFDILPVAGSGGILVPWALISLIMGDIGMAIGIIVIYVVITIIRQYIEPKIVGDSLGVNPIITLAGLYFGLKLFGFLGMFVVPICIMTLKAFNDTGRIKLWKNLDDAPKSK